MCQAITNNVNNKILEISKVCGSPSLSCLGKCGLENCDDFSNENMQSLDVHTLPNHYYIDLDFDDCKTSMQSFYLKSVAHMNELKTKYEKNEQDLKKLLSKVRL